MTLRLAEVELEDVRRFSGRWRVGPFAPGLNLLAAPNEAGKSTLLEAIRSAILLPHRAQGEEARRLRPLAGGTPTITLALAAASEVWRIRKRFAGPAGRAEVVAPDGRSWSGDAAEEEIRRLFGLPQPAGRGTPPRGVWGALWVEQGASLVQPELDRAAQDTLRGVLEAEIDTVTGVRGAARLRAAIARELLAFQTTGGQRTAGRLREVEDRLVELAEEERDLRARRDRAEKALARLAELRAQRAERLAARRELQAEQSLAEARRRLDELRRDADRRGSLEREATDAARLRDAAAQAWARREADIAAAAEAERQAAALARNADEAEGKAKAAADRRLALDAAEAAADAAEAEQHAGAVAEAVRRLREAEAAAAAAAPSRRASAAVVAAIVLAAIAASLSASAVLALVPAEAGWLGAALALVGALALSLRAILRARAATRAAEDARRRLDEARGALSLLAAEPSPQDALAAATARAEEARKRAAELQGEALARGLAIPAGRISAAERDALHLDADRAMREAVAARARANAAADTAARASAHRAEARARDSDEELRERLRRAEEKARRSAEAREAAPAPTAEDIAAAEAELHRCEADRKRIADEERRLAVDLAAAETEIRTLEAEGLDDRLAALAEECERLERERRALERERDGLRLLDRILAEEEEQAKAEWVAPVACAVGPWLATVLGAESVEIDQGLAIATIRRNGRAERVEILSAGTQEQIAVLVRLAFADLLERQGKPAPVILDDALAFSDDARIERLFDVLTEAAKTLQIILLTCREDLFRRLPAHALAFERLS